MEDEFKAIFDELVAKLRPLVDGLHGQLVTLDENLRFSSQFLPMFWELVKGVIEWAKAALDAFFAEVQHVIEHHAPFIALIVQAFNWLDNVKTPVSDLAGTATSSGSDNLIMWKGDAAAKYVEKCAPQVTALDAVTARADFVHNWLVDIVNANIAYTGKVVQQLATLGKKIAEIVGKAANPATAVMAVGDFKDLIITVVDTRVEEYTDIAVRLGAAAGQCGDVVSEMSDRKTFPGGTWPQAVA